jgi:pyruvate dehydrogenase E2 component (dihydrolipoamide acetyltransferase)
VHEFELPDVGEGVAEGEIVSWLVAVGDTVSEDQPVAEVETDKAVVEVPSPVDGSIAELHAAAGDVVPVGDVIVTFAVDGENDERTATPDRDDHPDPATRDTEPAGNGSTATGSTAGNGRVFAAPSARRLARELGVDIGAIDGSGPGGRIATGDIRTVAESDPDPPSEPVADESLASAADVTDPIGSSNNSSDDPSSVESIGDAATGPANRTRTLAAPATRRVARELGVPLDRVPASEQRNGEAFVTRQAVEGYARHQQAQDAEGQTTATGAGSDIESRDSAGGEQRIDYRGLRRTIGQAMKRSAYTAPHVSHHDTVDASALVETRQRLQPVAAERGISLTYLPFIAKACVAALREFPSLNGSLDEEREEIVLKEYYNVGIAVGTDAGLLVPVVDDVDRKGLLQIASEANELIEKARDRSIAREAMQGGTFTITNFGAVGGEYATPIINHPETAILGLGELTERPIALDGEVVARPTLPLSLSIDHRVIDGATAARFANRLQEFFAEPRLLLLE